MRRISRMLFAAAAEGVSCGVPIESAPSIAAAPRPLFGFVRVNGQGLSLFRICMALFVAYDVIFNALPFWDFIYSGNGVLPAEQRGTNVLWSFFSYSDNIIYRNVLLSIFGLCIFSLLIGFRARLSSFLCFLFYFAIMDRNPQADAGTDILANCLLLWGSFAPIGRYWSVDAALSDDAERNRPWPVIMAVAIKIQIAIVYFYSALFKLASEDWLSGRAINYAVHDEIYGSHFGQQAFSYVPTSLYVPMCWGIILFQLVFSALIYFPKKNDITRAIGLLGAITMHGAFIFFLQVHMFPFLCFTYLMALLPDHWLNRLFAKRRTRLAEIKIFYDPECGFCRAVSLLLREFCLSFTTPVRPASEDTAALELLRQHNSWVVYGTDRQTYLKWDAVSYVLKQSPVFWIFGWITGLKLLRRPMQALYDAIGNNRQKLSRLFGAVLSPRPPEVPERMTQYICLYLLCLMISYTTAILPQVKPFVTVPYQYQLTVRQMGVQQTWDLFAPGVPAWRWSWDINAWDAEGHRIDLSPILASHMRRNVDHWVFPASRVLKFYSRMMGGPGEGNRFMFAHYLCRETARLGTPAKKVRIETQLSHAVINEVEPSYWVQVDDCAKP